MASFNRVVLMGNLTRDPQLSYTPSNTPVCEFSLAINRKWRDRDGNMQEEVSYIDLNSFGKSAETINQYMSKGSAILIEGRIRQRRWTNKEGQNRSKLDVVVDNFQFVGGGRGSGGAGPVSDRGESAPAGKPMGDEPPPPSDADIPF